MRRNREAIALVKGWMKEDPAYEGAQIKRWALPGTFGS